MHLPPPRKDRQAIRLPLWRRRCRRRRALVAALGRIPAIPQARAARLRGLRAHILRLCVPLARGSRTAAQAPARRGRRRPRAWQPVDDGERVRGRGRRRRLRGFGAGRRALANGRARCGGHSAAARARLATGHAHRKIKSRPSAPRARSAARGRLGGAPRALGLRRALRDGPDWQVREIHAVKNRRRAQAVRAHWAAVAVGLVHETVRRRSARPARQPHLNHARTVAADCALGEGAAAGRGRSFYGQAAGAVHVAGLPLGNRVRSQAERARAQTADAADRRAARHARQRVRHRRQRGRSDVRLRHHRGLGSGRFASRHGHRRRAHVLPVRGAARQLCG
mmetsp:Transcript_13372/g.34054  ORF Transcript_13372/g.34054 Transcript_13372/m.34054 type:complete len:338 (+) Transcript_13372:302-1315(+)